MDKNVQSCTIPHLQYNTNFVLQIVSFNVLNWPNANYGDVKCNVQGLYYTKVVCWFNLYNSHIFGADPSLCQCLKYKYKQEKIQIQRLHCKGTHCWFNLYHTTISGAQAQVCEWPKYKYKWPKFKPTTPSSYLSTDWMQEMPVSSICNLIYCCGATGNIVMQSRLLSPELWVYFTWNYGSIYVYGWYVTSTIYFKRRKCILDYNHCINCNHSDCIRWSYIGGGCH